MEFRPAFHVPKETVECKDQARWVQHFIESLEEQVRRHPSNSNEYFFWEELGGLVA
jgi:hypothetical protein